MKLKELLDIRCDILGETEITGVTCDTRRIKSGNVFVCISGAQFDGHTYAEAAVAAGAAVVVAQRDTGVKNQILVDDTHAVFARMCAKWFGNPANDLKIIGVTGTNGKSSITYMIKSILEHAGFKVGLIGTIHNMIGDEIVPSKNTTPGPYELHELFYLMKQAGCEYAVIEVSSHALDQKRVYGVQFDVAIFTNLTQDHLDYHKTMDGYFAAKQKLFSMCKTAVINYDDKYGQRLLEETNCKKISYSLLSDAATYTAKNPEYYPDGIVYQMVGYNFIAKIKFGTGGKFTVYNTMCAAAAAVEIGIDVKTICEALSSMSGIKGRMESVKTGRDFSVIIDYAHTPDGLMNVLKTFRECKGYRLVALFGCGGDRDRTKRPLMGEIAANYADYVVVTSDNPRSEPPAQIIEDILQGMKNTKTPYKVIENRVEAIKYAVANARAKDIIVLAGKGHETYQILNNGTIHLDEREVVAEALSELKD